MSVCLVSANFRILIYFSRFLDSYLLYLSKVKVINKSISKSVICYYAVDQKSQISHQLASKSFKKNPNRDKLYWLIYHGGKEDVTIHWNFNIRNSKSVLSTRHRDLQNILLQFLQSIRLTYKCNSQSVIVNTHMKEENITFFLWESSQSPLTLNFIMKSAIKFLKFMIFKKKN